MWLNFEIFLDLNKLLQRDDVLELRHHSTTAMQTSKLSFLKVYGFVMLTWELQILENFHFLKFKGEYFFLNLFGERNNRTKFNSIEKVRLNGWSDTLVSVKTGFYQHARCKSYIRNGILQQPLRPLSPLLCGTRITATDEKSLQFNIMTRTI